MTSTDIVDETAAVVAELRNEAAHMPDFEHVYYGKIMIKAADLIERLSRESGTGVPEGWPSLPKSTDVQAAVDSIIDCYAAEIITAGEFRKLVLDAVAEAVSSDRIRASATVVALEKLLRYFGGPQVVSMAELGHDAYVALEMKVRIGDLIDARALLSAAPQPPSVSDQAGETAFGAKDVLGRPTAPEAWLKAAQEETRNWTLPGLGEDDDPHCGYPLIDALSNPGKNATVKEGIERAAELADDVVLAVWKVAEPEIASLSAELVEARKALAPFAEASETFVPGGRTLVNVVVKTKELQRARAALSATRATEAADGKRS
jgi:hypothetical protein